MLAVDFFSQKTWHVLNAMAVYLLLNGTAGWAVLVRAGFTHRTGLPGLDLLSVQFYLSQNQLLALYCTPEIIYDISVHTVFMANKPHCK